MFARVHFRDLTDPRDIKILEDNLNKLLFAGGLFGGPGGSNREIQYNNNGIFGGDPSFQIYVGASVRMYMNMQLIFDNDDGANTNIKYNSSNNYLEVTVDGDLRLQM